MVVDARWIARKLMSTRTFIGFAFLVVALLVAATPSVLNPLAGSIQDGLAAAGVDGAKPRPISIRPIEKGQGGPEAVTNELVLKGYLVGEQDFRDQSSGVRSAETRTRTTSGARRAGLPGRGDGIDPLHPAVTIPGGVLLDVSGCPVFRDGLDLPALWANPALQGKYLAKAAAADDPATCRARLEALVNNAALAPETGATMRAASRERRADNQAYAMLLNMNGLLASMFPELDERGAPPPAETAVPATTATDTGAAPAKASSR